MQYGDHFGTPTSIATFTKSAITLELPTTIKQANLSNPASGYTNIGARASDGRPVYYANGGSQLVLANTSEIPSGILTTTGDMIVSLSGSTPSCLGIGSTGQTLTVVGGVPAWANGVLAVVTTAGDLVYGTGANAIARLGIGTARQTLLTNAGATAPEWGASLQSLMTGTGDLVVSSGANTPARLAIGTARQVLSVNTGANGFSYVASLQSLMTAQGDIVQASAANTPARLALGTARQTLAVNSGATALEYVASMQSLLTTQGDLIYASSANTPARLAKGSAGTVLTMNAGATAPEWAASAAAGLVKLGEATGTGSSGVIEVTGISASYRSLYFELDGGRSSAAVTAAVIRMTVESSPTSGAYNNQRLFAGATAVAADENIGTNDFVNVGIVPGASSPANLPGSLSTRVPGYASTSPFKTVISLNCGPSDLATGAISSLMSVGVIELTAAIDRIRLTLSTGNWTTTSRLTVWGLPT